MLDQREGRLAFELAAFFYVLNLDERYEFASHR